MNTKDVEVMTTASGRTVKIRVKNVGEAFGCIGQVIGENGRVIAETEAVPFGFTGAAIDGARLLVGSMR